MGSFSLFGGVGMSIIVSVVVEVSLWMGLLSIAFFSCL